MKQTFIAPVHSYQLILGAWMIGMIRSFYGFDEGLKNVLGWGYGLIGIYLILEAILLKAVLHRARKTGTLIKLSE